MDLEAWTQKQLELVDMERMAEEAQTADEQETLSLKQLEERGVVIGSLVLTERKHGLGGRTLVTLCRSKALGGKKNDKGKTESSGSEPLLPAHCFGGGDIVALRKANVAHVPSSSSKEQELRGLVYRVMENKIVVALDSGDTMIPLSEQQQQQQQQQQDNDDESVGRRAARWLEEKSK